MQAFVLNRHGRMVFPSNIMPELDFSTMESLDQLDRVIRRDFETKAPTGTDILHKVEKGSYDSRYALMRDMALNLFWANRFAMTMYDKRPTRWADVPRTRADVFLPVLTPWVDGDAKVAAVRDAYATLPAQWDPAVEDRIFDVLFDVFGHRKHHATTLPAVKTTVAQCLAEPTNLTFRLRGYDPDFPVYDYTDIVTAARTWPSSRPCTAGRWCCTTSTRGTARRSSWWRSASSRTTTSSWPSTRATRRCAGSCDDWRPAR